MLLPYSADRLSAMLIQSVVNDHKDYAPLGAQCFDQNPEKLIRHKINAPSPYPRKSVNAGKTPRMKGYHGQNHLVHGVLYDGQRPSDQKSYKNAVTRSAETSLESNLVNPKRMWYFSVHLGVPPSPLFVSKKRVRGERLLFQAFYL
ncbi:MAG: hypothetical protein ACP5VS_07105 [Desulfomonilaceae bacterium]